MSTRSREAVSQGKSWNKWDLGQIQADSARLLLSTAARAVWHRQGEEIPARPGIYS